MSAYLEKQKLIILDGTLPTIEGASIKIRKASKVGKHVRVHLVLPASLLVAFIAFLNRERKFSLEHFYRTHSKSRQTALEIARHYDDLDIEIYVSSVDFVGTGSTMSFKRVAFENRRQLVEFLEQNQYTEEEIRKEVFNT